MSFVPNDHQQLSLFDSLGFLSQRKRRMLENSWAETFSSHIFTHIDEHIFAPLYSEKTNSRPNAPINVIVGALILKEFTGMTDDEIRESCEFDFRFQYALHTTSFEEQPISDRTFSRFRECCEAYELTTGEDLIHQCIVSLSEEIRQYMGISKNIRRMDSMMIEANIRKMGRLELLYTCISSLVKRIQKDGSLDLPAVFNHYAEANDRNRVVYHDSDLPQAKRLQTVISDAAQLLPLCKEDYEQTKEYQLLERALNEQTKDDGKGGRTPKGKGEMNSSVLQNPSDPDATYRVKAGKAHRGYAANLTESVNENGSVVTDYQYDVNTRSDRSFLLEALDQMESSKETSAVITDGSYSGADVLEKAAEKNIGILTTGLTGRKLRKDYEQFRFSEDGTEVLACPEGKKPKRSNYNPGTRRIRVSFYKEQCENCPRRSECHPVLKVRTAVLILPSGDSRTVQEQKERRTEEEVWKLIGRIRNGIETVPSIIRNKYRVDHMPVRGKLRTKQFFSFKVAALNFTKLILHERNQEFCRTFLPE